MIGPEFSGDWRELPISTLAYIGDAVYELYVRLTLCRNSACRSGDLHRQAVCLVKASAQAKGAQTILPLLSEPEAAVFRRGRNTQPSSQAKHADPIDYRLATGLEALIGYLYLNHEETRLLQLMQILVEGKDHEQTEPT
jgi:ribonuclease-3 family protein